MDFINKLIKQTEKIDFLFPNSFEELMNNDYFDYDKFEWFLYYVFQLIGATTVQKIGKKGKGDGGADLIVSHKIDNVTKRIGIQAKYWKYRVGVDPINQLASAKVRHDLDDLWIITTSDLTTDAKDVAEIMKIRILRSDDVAKMIEQVKEIHKKEVEETGESKISFIVPKEKEGVSKKEIKSEPAKEEDSYAVSEFKKLRIELATKHKISPLYMVFNNETMNLILETKPVNLDNLEKIKGMSKDKCLLFGQDILDLLKSLDVHFLYEHLIAKRPEIAKFNKLNEKDLYSDKVAMNLAKFRPRTKEALAKVFGFNKDHIEIYGDYLLKTIANFNKN